MKKYFTIILSFIFMLVLILHGLILQILVIILLQNISKMKLIMDKIGFYLKLTI